MQRGHSPGFRLTGSRPVGVGKGEMGTLSLVTQTSRNLGNSSSLAPVFS